MKSTIRLFKAVPITAKGKKKADKVLLEKTIKKGFIFAPEVISNYSTGELNALIKLVSDEIGLTEEQLNNAFHKSWKKIKEASIEQLVIEQLIHYFTTYGYKALGIYDKSTVFIPKEKLEIPKIDVEGITLVVIKGYTEKELKEKLMSMLSSGIALAEDTIKDVIAVAAIVGITEKDIQLIKNKEVKISLYDNLKLFPENPTEFLRYAVYKSTGKTLLIKNKVTTEEIKESENVMILSLFVKYKKKYSLKRLAEIFNRFKPIFLAYKGTNTQINAIINKIRKLAKKHHKPMLEDYLNAVTGKIKKGEKIDEKELQEALAKANVFRKIRLLYALHYRLQYNSKEDKI